MDSAIIRALSFVPQGNTDTAGIIGAMESTGTLTGDGHPMVNEQNNPEIGWFGGIARIPLAPLRL